MGDVYEWSSAGIVRINNRHHDPMSGEEATRELNYLERRSVEHDCLFDRLINQRDMLRSEIADMKKAQQ